MKNLQIEFPLNNQFLSLKNFNTIDHEYQVSLLEKLHCSLADIQVELEKPFSKFNTDIIANPEKLIPIVKKIIEENDYTIKSTTQEIQHILFDCSGYFPGSPIGFDKVIPVSELSQNQRITIRFKHVDGFRLQTIEAPPKPTNFLNILTITKNQSLIIKDIFPGIYAPPFPEVSKMSHEDYVRSLIFWRDHVFALNKTMR